MDWGKFYERAFIVLIVVAAVFCALSYLADDISWFLILGERLLGGDRPYIDFFDPNPPAAIFLYLPAVLAERWTGISAEAYVAVLTIASASLSVWYSASLLHRYEGVSAGAALKLKVTAAFLLLLLPGHAYAQREHFALIGLLPYLALAVLRAGGRRPGKWACLIAGSLAGSVLCLKPFFVLPVLLVALYLLLRHWHFLLRKWRHPFPAVLSLENSAAAAVLLLYCAAVWRFMPAYFEVAVPKAMAIYGPYRTPFLLFFRVWGSMAIVAALITFALAARLGRERPMATVFALAGLGFVACYLIQGKGYAYHALPAIALLLLAAAAALSEGFEKEWWLKPTRMGEMLVLSAAFSAMGLAFLSNTVPLGYPAFYPVAQRAAPAHPKVLALSPMLAGPFLARHLHGVSVSYTASLYMSVRAEELLQEKGLAPERIRQIESGMRWDEGLQMRSLAQKPDLLVVDSEGVQWAKARPAVLAELRHYKPAGDADGYLFLVRR